MSGDWMKVVLDLPEKPEVLEMASILKMHPDEVVGKLIKVWRWFNQQTTDGHANGVTILGLSAVVGHAQFGDTMAHVGWLTQSGTVLVMPNFERHNSESAKKRALDSERQRKFRHAGGVTKNGQVRDQRREEKRRIKDNPPLIPPSGGKRPPKRGTVMPDGFQPSESHRTLAATLAVDCQLEFEKFRDHHGARGTTFKDWGLALNTWLRNANTYAQRTARVNGSHPARESWPERSAREMREQAERVARSLEEED